MAGTGRKVLIVDRDVALSGAVAEALAAYNYSASTARSEIEALNAIKADPPALVLVELQLAESNGIDLLRMICSRHPSIVCIAMSAGPEADAVVEAQRAGAADYLAKPVPLVGLLAALGRGFDRLERERQLALAYAELVKVKEQLRRAELGHTEMLARIGRELRQPLNVLLGHAEIMRSQLCGPLGDSRYVDYAQRMIGEAQRMCELVGRIGDRAAIESGALTLADDQFNIVDLVTECAADARIGPHGEGRSFNLRLPQQPHLVVGDRWRLRQAIAYVIDNAARLTPAGGRIAVSLTFTHARDIEIRVEDEGPGIAEADRAQLLEPLFPLGGLAAAKGADLGLCLAAGYMKLHGGNIKLASEPGRGTTVSLILPGSRLAADAAGVASDPASGVARGYSHSATRSSPSSHSLAGRSGHSAGSGRAGSGGTSSAKQRRLAEILRSAVADSSSAVRRGDAPMGPGEAGAERAADPSPAPLIPLPASDRATLFRFVPVKGSND